MKRVAVLPIAALLLALGGCGGGTDDEAAAATSTASPSGAGVVGTASCTDAAGDGGPADLTGVELVGNGGALRATFTLAAPLDTSTGTQLLALQVSSADGSTAKQFGAKWIDGEPVVFVADLGGDNRYVDVPPEVDGATVRVLFPGSALEGLGDTWTWRAASNLDGSDVDACPEPGEDPLNPQQQTFPG